ncbi:MAG: hydrogenase maturation protease [Polyangiaceae bacterium]|nr:hydrogenase maturation protease [Polyangiaceae bacterium]
MSAVLVAGVGNLFLGDDGFGCEVARRLASRLGARAEVRDFGIRALDLKYALERHAHAVVIDVTRRGGSPGTLYVLDPATEERVSDVVAHHGMVATDVVQWAVERGRQGDNPRALRIVACEPESFGDEEEGRLGLSDPVAASVEGAVRIVEDLVAELAGEKPCTSWG